MTPGRLRDTRPKSSLFGLFFAPDTKEIGTEQSIRRQLVHESNLKLGYLKGTLRKGSLSPSRNTTITHKKITELIPKQFRFGNSSTQITE